MEYALPELEAAVATVSVRLDGICMLLCEDGWHQAMVWAPWRLALFDPKGERLHTLYVAATPEYGKSTFLGCLERELERLKARYPQATYLGLADGAEGNWWFLNSRTTVQLVDFYHASSYLQAAAVAAFLQEADSAARAAWLHDRCHRLKHQSGAAYALLQEMKASSTARLTPTQRKSLEQAITYFYYHHPQMDYANALQHYWPIGSGVTEAACKTLVKQRLCRSGMR